MLVIRRRMGESILIGGDIEVEILEIGATKVKLGIAGPKSISIVRKEIQLAAHANLCAGSLNPELRAMVVKRVAESIQVIGKGVDKTSESRYSGHPITKESPDSAGR
jgi:carbon storage regulator